MESSTCDVEKKVVNRPITRLSLSRVVNTTGGETANGDTQNKRTEDQDDGSRTSYHGVGSARPGC